jgi:hypothetical protein
MQYDIFVFFSYSIVIAAIIGGVRFRKIDPAFHPFVFYTWLASLNEILSYIISEQGNSNVFNNNIYVLAEAFLITWQVKKWGIFYNNKGYYKALQSLLVVIWFYELFKLNDPSKIHYYFRIFYSAIVVIMCMHITGKLLFAYTRPVYKNAQFLICLGYIFFFTFKILVETFWLLGIDNTDTYLYGVYSLIAWINLFVNFIFIIALLWIPLKPNYITFT